MKRLLLPLIAALTLPTAASAETYWLLVGVGGKNNPNGSLATLPMSSMLECDAAGKKIYEARGKPHGIHGDVFYSLRYVCVKGK